MSATVLGRYGWSATRDEEGHRTYQLVNLVYTSATTEGPYAAMNATGLVTPGTAWSIGTDADAYALCWPNLEARPHQVEDEPNVWWLVEQTFSTKPFKRCQDTAIESPLSEPAKISGSFVKKSKVVETDRNDDLIKSSSHELVLGITKDSSTPSVVIEYNISSLDLDDLCAIIDTVNDATLWGFDPRCVKLSNIVWSRNVYGTCSYYYTRRFEFDIDPETFDEKKVVDRGFKHFDIKRYPDATGTGDARRDDPNNFIVNRDVNGIELPEQLYLNGFGDILDDIHNPVYLPTIELYDETNFLLYGIPSSLT